MNLTINTERLQLRTLFPGDEELIALFYQKNIPFLAAWEPNVNQNMADPGTQRSALEYELDRVKKGTFVRYWYSTKEHPEILLGTICFQNITMSAFHSCQIGYKQDIGACGRGYATEAVKASCEHMFRNENIHRIVANTVTDNDRSIKLLRNAGFEYEGEEKSSVMIGGAWKDCYRFALINKY